MGAADSGAETAVRDLIWACREAGQPSRDLVVLAEGNASTPLGDGTFICTASGSRLADVRSEEMVRLRLEPILTFLRSGATAGESEAIAGARYLGAGPRPSIETFLHAVCLEAIGGGCVLHTHPTRLVGILAAPEAQAILTAGPLFPDEAVVCGLTPLYVEYFSPGIELGRALDSRLEAYIGEHREPPRVIYLANHGLVALGQTPREALAITEMAVKAASVRLVAIAAGGLRPLRPDLAASLVTRNDELRRRERLARSST